MGRSLVKLNIYDMYWINDYASVLGVGVYHSGVEVHGVEYAYGGHPYTFSGIFENSPGDAEELGENFKFKEAIILGETDFTAYEVKKMVQQMGQDYRGDRYHLISKNCNHFSANLAKFLTGQDIPGWVNRLATMSGSLPFFERWIPQEWLTPVALQQSLDEKANRSGNATNSTDAQLNYPVAIGQDALEGYGSPSASKKAGNTLSGSQSARSTRDDNSSLFNGARSTPNSSRASTSSLSVSGTSSNSNGQAAFSFSKIWTSVKTIASDIAVPMVNAPIPAPAPPAPTAAPTGSRYRPAAMAASAPAPVGAELDVTPSSDESKSPTSTIDSDDDLVTCVSSTPPRRPEPPTRTTSTRSNLSTPSTSNISTANPSTPVFSSPPKKPSPPNKDLPAPAKPSPNPPSSSSNQN
uniref:PPPDE domain-containing protein n=1 Tax=Panagrellus redivivus TaxID=6233 RepID=A0A7E4VP12_PANRE